MPALKARALKCTAVLDQSEIAGIGDLPTARVILHIAVPDFGTVSADVSAKSVRKAQGTISEHGTDGVAVIIQGKLVAGSRLIEAGLVAQVRAPKPQMETAV